MIEDPGVEAVRGAGLKPLGIDLSAFALLQALDPAEAKRRRPRPLPPRRGDESRGGRGRLVSLHPAARRPGARPPRGGGPPPSPQPARHYSPASAPAPAPPSGAEPSRRWPRRPALHRLLHGPARRPLGPRGGPLRPGGRSDEPRGGAARGALSLPVSSPSPSAPSARPDCRRGRSPTATPSPRAWPWGPPDEAGQPPAGALPPGPGVGPGAGQRVRGAGRARCPADVRPAPWRCSASGRLAPGGAGPAPGGDPGRPGPRHPARRLRLLRGAEGGPGRRAAGSREGAWTGSGWCASSPCASRRGVAEGRAGEQGARLPRRSSPRPPARRPPRPRRTAHAVARAAPRARGGGGGARAAARARPRPRREPVGVGPGGGRGVRPGRLQSPSTGCGRGYEWSAAVSLRPPSGCGRRGQGAGEAGGQVVSLSLSSRRSRPPRRGGARRPPGGVLAPPARAAARGAGELEGQVAQQSQARDRARPGGAARAGAVHLRGRLRDGGPPRTGDPHLRRHAEPASAGRGRRPRDGRRAQPGHAGRAGGRRRRERGGHRRHPSHARRARARAGGHAGLDTVPLQLTLSGDFFGLADFLHRQKRFVRVAEERVEVKGRLMTIDSFHFAAADGGRELTAEVSATVYLSPKAGRAPRRRRGAGRSRTASRGRAGGSALASRGSDVAMRVLALDVWQDLRDKRLWPVALALLVPARGRARGAPGRGEEASPGAPAAPARRRGPRWPRRARTEAPARSSRPSRPRTRSSPTRGDGRAGRPAGAAAAASTPAPDAGAGARRARAPGTPPPRPRPRRRPPRRPRRRLPPRRPRRRLPPRHRRPPRPRRLGRARVRLLHRRRRRAFGGRGSGRARRGVARLEPLPTSGEPVATFLGTTPSGRSASSSCRRGSRWAATAPAGRAGPRCTFLTLRPDRRHDQGLPEGRAGGASGACGSTPWSRCRSRRSWRTSRRRGVALALGGGPCAGATVEVAGAALNRARCAGAAPR